MKKSKRTKVWIPITRKLPPVKTKVELKRDFSVGAGGFTGFGNKFEWISVGRYSYFNSEVRWSIKKEDGLTLRNTDPTHWRHI